MGLGVWSILHRILVRVGWGYGVFEDLEASIMSRLTTHFVPSQAQCPTIMYCHC